MTTPKDPYAPGTLVTMGNRAGIIQLDGALAWDSEKDTAEAPDDDMVPVWFDQAVSPVWEYRHNLELR